MTIQIRNMRRLIIITVFFISCVDTLQVSGQLYVQNGAQVSSNNNAVICLQNEDFINNGSISLQGNSDKIIFTGNSNNYVDGDSVSIFNELDIAKSNASLLLKQDMQITGSIQFDSGLIDLNGKNILLQQPTTLLVNENENSRITGLSGGSVSISNNSVNAPSQYNIGNLGAMISSAQNLGQLSVSRSHIPATVGANSSIQRTFYIAPSNNNSLAATLRFYYFDAELNGKDKTTLALWKSTDGNTWQLVGADNNDVASNYVEKTGINDLSYWTLSDAGNALPLTLLSFSATCKNDYALLQWATGTEQGIQNFIIEKSIDGTHWYDAGSESAKDLASGSAYEWRDSSESGHAYYRLKIGAITGAFSYSPVFAGGCDDVSMPFAVYPNPADNAATVRLSVRQSIRAQLSLLSITGQLLEQHEWYLQTGVNTYNLTGISKLASGTYVIQLHLKKSSFQLKLIKR